MEVFFGLIMVLTFTGTISVVESGRAEVRTLLIGALGCNIAWGLIDAIMYVMTSITERNQNLSLVNSIRAAKSPEAAHAAIAAALPPVAVGALRKEDMERIRGAVVALPPSPPYASVTAQDLLGAVGIFLLVAGSTFPVIAPFLFLNDIKSALLASHAVAVVMLFGLGYAYARMAGYHRVPVAALMVLLGIVLVAMTIALGG
jgi:VIT1/CCC1 family predicted Fe2+/Mn2+ transporter